MNHDEWGDPSYNGRRDITPSLGYRDRKQGDMSFGDYIESRTRSGNATPDNFGVGRTHRTQQRQAGGSNQQPMQSHRGRGPNQQRSDERILEDVCERLTDAPDVDASEVTVTCAQGLVTLEGTVDSRATKHRIEDLVDECRGVKDIANRLTVDFGRHALYQEQQVAQGNRQ